MHPLRQCHVNAFISCLTGQPPCMPKWLPHTLIRICHVLGSSNEFRGALHQVPVSHGDHLSMLFKCREDARANPEQAGWRNFSSNTLRIPPVSDPQSGIRGLAPDRREKPLPDIAPCGPAQRGAMVPRRSPTVKSDAPVPVTSHSSSTHVSVQEGRDRFP